MTKHSSLYLQLKKIFQCELELFPQAGAQDLAKLLYQAVYGPQHAVLAPEKLYDWLNQEMQALNPHPSEPLLQPVWLHYPMFRLHLSAAAHNLLDIQLIHDLFLQSCSEPTPSFPISWNELIDMSFHLLNQLSQENDSMLSNELKALAFSKLGPFHHSESYRKTYSPHYRLISLHAIQELSAPDSILFIEAHHFL